MKISDCCGAEMTDRHPIRTGRLGLGKYNPLIGY